MTFAESIYEPGLSSMFFDLETWTLLMVFDDPRHSNTWRPGDLDSLTVLEVDVSTADGVNIWSLVNAALDQTRRNNEVTPGAAKC